MELILKKGGEEQKKIEKRLEHEALIYIPTMS
jgi:hypothetical protein